MHITRIEASNWRNFKTLKFDIRKRLFLVGPNAAGKSNLLDLFRFLGDIAAPGGGLAAAMESRGGFSRVRSLFARNHEGGRIIVDVRFRDGDDDWRYRLAIKGEGRGKHRPLVDEELVERNGKAVLKRPDRHDKEDDELRTQTHLEQISANFKFRPLAEHLARVQYFHLVPQIIRDVNLAGEHGKPYGSDFIAQMNATPKRTRDAWLGRIQKALRAAVPEFESIEIWVDAAGRPHLRAGYRNWRSRPTVQTEAEFSDGTLRLIGLLWTLVSIPANGGVLLLEEPELSLNSAIVKMLPTVLAMAQRDREQQIVLSTHAPELLDDEGIQPDEVLVLRVTRDGTTAQLLSEIEKAAPEVEARLPVSGIVQDLIAPSDPGLPGLVEVGARR